MNQDDVFYQAMLARDHRFDGKFYVGVKTTGIFCRPICPAKPLRKNIVFYSNAIDAYRAGLRPCQRCRPESAPSSALWLGKSAVVRRAMKMLLRPDFFDKSEEEFAEIFGVSARHLRRLFEDEVGLTPKQIASQNRIGFARKLVIETQLTMTVIATSSGFKSLRRFNDAFLNYFKVSPTRMRGDKANVNNEGLTLLLSYRPPLDWDGLLAFFKNHRLANLEVVEGNEFKRIFLLDGNEGEFRLSPTQKEGELRLVVKTDSPQILFEIARRVRRMFDLDSDPLLIDEAFKKNSEFKKIRKRYPGMRIPGCWDPFEASISAILGQLVSVKQANILIEELIENYGLKHNGKRFFPGPEILMKSDLLKLRTTTKRRETIRDFSKRVFLGEIDLSGTQDVDEFKKNLLDIPGIGAWSVEYISLRAISDTDAFPKTDLVLKRALANNLKLNHESIRPWRAYGAMYLWKEHYETLLH